ncbi:IS3 family transposase [Aerococcaceae bacterium WGS1372]
MPLLKASSVILSANVTTSTSSPTYQSLKQAIEDYMTFYNERPFQDKLNNLTPLEFRYQVAV